MSSTRLVGIRTAVLVVAALTVVACSKPEHEREAAAANPVATRIADREAIEEVLARVNQGFEFSDANLFAEGFAEDSMFELVVMGEGPVFGYKRIRYDGRDQIREIITDRVENARAADPKTLTYDPATLRRYNRNSDSRIQIVDATHARHWSTWMVVMKTNVDIHTSAIGRYEDQLEKIDGKWLITNRKRIE